MVNKQKHLTRKDRRFIEEGIVNGANKVSIASVLQMVINSGQQGLNRRPGRATIPGQ